MNCTNGNNSIHFWAPFKGTYEVAVGCAFKKQQKRMKKESLRGKFKSSIFFTWNVRGKVYDELRSTSFKAHWDLYLNSGYSFSILALLWMTHLCNPQLLYMEHAKSIVSQILKDAVDTFNKKCCHQITWADHQCRRTASRTKDSRIKDLFCPRIFNRYSLVPRYSNYISKQFKSISEMDSMSLSLRETQREAEREIKSLENRQGKKDG